MQGNKISCTDLKTQDFIKLQPSNPSNQQTLMILIHSNSIISKYRIKLSQITPADNNQSNNYGGQTRFKVFHFLHKFSSTSTETYCPSPPREKYSKMAQKMYIYSLQIKRTNSPANQFLTVLKNNHLQKFCFSGIFCLM